MSPALSNWWTRRAPEPHDTVIESLLSVALSVVLLLSGFTKMLDRASFLRALSSTYRVWPRLRPHIARFIPLAELATGVLIIAPSTRQLGLTLGTVLLCAISVFVAVQWGMGARGDCGCFGLTVSSKLGPSTLARSLGLTVVSMTLALIHFGI
jgi:hypothetical protein